MVVPAAIYVAIIAWIGIYFSSLLLIAFFMKRLGNYGWHLIVAIAVGVPSSPSWCSRGGSSLPLPKGPIEAWLGF